MMQGYEDPVMLFVLTTTISDILLGKEFCSKCNSGILKPTKYSNMWMCDYFGISKCELTMEEFMESRKSS
jgi:hypothetical protein